MIGGVQVKDVQDIANDQGSIQHMLRSDERLFQQFGEIYFSTTNPGVLKGWHQHEEQTSVLSCVAGELALGLHDLREGPTKGESMTIVFGDNNRKVVSIPPGVAYAWKNNGSEKAILANCATHPHDPKKSRKIHPDDIPHDL